MRIKKFSGGVECVCLWLSFGSDIFEKCYSINKSRHNLLIWFYSHRMSVIVVLYACLHVSCLKPSLFRNISWLRRCGLLLCGFEIEFGSFMKLSIPVKRVSSGNQSITAAALYPTGVSTVGCSSFLHIFSPLVFLLASRYFFCVRAYWCALYPQQPFWFLQSLVAVFARNFRFLFVFDYDMIHSARIMFFQSQ